MLLERAPTPNRTEPGKLRAWALALLVHLVFFALLALGVTWQSKQPAPVEAELWSSLPAQAPKAESVPEPERPKRVTQAEPKLEPKPEPKFEPKPDIALKEQRERNKREQAEQLKQEQVKKKQIEEKQRKLKEEQAKKLTLEKEAKTASEQAHAAQAAQKALVDEYADRIRKKIHGKVVPPPDIQGNPEIELELSLLITGDLRDPPKIVKSSGNRALDDAIVQAVVAAQPLPVPSSRVDLFNSNFRPLKLKYRPYDPSSN